MEYFADLVSVAYVGRAALGLPRVYSKGAHAVFASEFRGEIPVDVGLSQWDT